MVLAPSILGVSPGSRFLGIALLKYGDVVDAKIKPFNGGWSTKKLERVEAYFTELMTKYSVKIVILTLPRTVYRTIRLREVITRINAVAKQCNCEVVCFENHVVKQHFFGKRRTHRKMLVKKVVEITQDFLLEANREKDNESGYYLRMFEAIAALLMYRAKNT